MKNYNCKVWGGMYARHLRCKGCVEEVGGTGDYPHEIMCKKDHCIRCGAEMKPLRKRVITPCSTSTST